MNMNLGAEKLSSCQPIRFYQGQELAARYIGQRNARKLYQLARLGLDFLIRGTELNNGIVPMPEQIRIQRALAKRAKRDRKRSRK